jgi:integrase
MRISNRTVSSIACPPGKDRSIFWDDDLSGFGVVAHPSGKRVYVIQYRQHGRSRRMKIGEHGRLTPDEARSQAKVLLGAVEGGTDPIELRKAAARQKTFRAVADAFMQEHVAAKRKRRTEAEYRSMLDRHLLPALGSRRMGDIRKADLARLHSKLTGDGVPTSANRALAVFSSIWNWAAKRDEAEGPNPAAGIEKNPERKMDRFLTIEELTRLGQALNVAETEGLPPAAKRSRKQVRLTKIDPHAIAAIRLLLLTGARLREILHAEWDWVDWQRGLLRLPDSKTGPKSIYLSAPALTVLKAIPRLKNNPYIIPGEGPRQASEKTAKKPAPAPRHDLKRPWAALRSAAQLKGVRIHDLRHSFAATGAAASLGLPIIGKLLGHSQPVTTARYAHLDADPMRHAANVIGGQIAAALEGRKAEVIAFRK